MYATRSSGTTSGTGNTRETTATRITSDGFRIILGGVLLLSEQEW